MQQIQDHIDTTLKTSIDRLCALLRIPSISTDSTYASQCRTCADHIKQMLEHIGFKTQVHETPGHPIVLGHYKKPGAPHILFYGHYDVQPVDPLEEWTTPPFEPQLMIPHPEPVEGSRDQTLCFDKLSIREGKIIARGACDDKGQIMTFIEACRAWKDTTGELPLSVSILIEGEEESGSKNLPAFVESHAEELKADLILVCDTSMWDQDTPAITAALRGLMHEEITITCANRDLHSGMFGGAARNPIHVVAKLISALHDETGKITIPQFYEGVEELPQEVKQSWQALGVTPEKFLSPIGLSLPAGEQGRLILEQISSRPTCDVNGIIAGYTGEGTKTVIPSKASTKISFRLVGNQDPEAIRKNFRNYARTFVPEDCTIDFVSHGGSKAMTVNWNNPAFQKASRALEEEWGRAPVMMGCGGSIPIIGLFKEKLNMEPLMIGFGLDDDRIHSPNEKYNLSSFHKGIRSWARILEALAK